MAAFASLRRLRRVLGVVLLLSTTGVGAAGIAGAVPPGNQRVRASINDVTVTEGTGGDTTATFTVTLSRLPRKSLSLNYATANGTALAPDDYLVATGTLAFLPGELTKTVSVTIKGDALDEANEAFYVNLSSTFQVKIRDGQGVGTINDDDTQPPVSIGDASVTEGDADPVAATFAITLGGPSAVPVSVTYATADGTATAGADYTAVTPTVVTFAPGETSKTVAVAVLGDAADEPSETFSVVLSANTNIADGTGTGTIFDNDPLASSSLSIGDASVAEGASLVFTVTREAAGAASVDFTTAPSSAVAGTDYTETSGTLSFAIGQTTATITVPTTADTIDEGASETLLVNLSNPVGATIADSQGVGTIVDDDVAPTISISDAVVPEGDAGVGATATFNLTLSHPSSSTVSVSFGTTSGTATSGSDFAATVGTVTWNPGEVAASATVPITGDTIDEPDETFTVTLNTPVNAQLGGDVTGQATIVDDDPSAMPEVSIADASVVEGDSQAVSLSFAVTLSDFSDGDVSVNYTTVAGSAVAGEDFTSTSGTLTIPAGDTIGAVTVEVLADLVDEPSETLVVQLSSPSGGILSDDDATGTIVDNDEPTPPARTVSVGDASVVEGNSADTVLSFPLTLSSAASTAVAVAYTTADATALAPDDYVATSGTVYFAVGETTQTVTVTVEGDVEQEPDETLFLNLTSASVGLSDPQGTGTIVDNDADTATTFYVINDPAPVTEGASLSFTVTRSGATTGVTTVQFATASGTAQAGTDFAGASLTTLTFGAGDTTKSVVVQTLQDALDEDTQESFFVNLYNPSAGGVVVDGQGLGRIEDANDDVAPTVTVADAGTVAEGTAAVFQVSLSAASGRPVTVDHTTSSGSAGAADFTATTGSTVLQPGETSFDVSVPTTDDAIDENDESFTLTATRVVNATYADATGSATITDGDPPPALSVSVGSTTEGDTAVFTVTLSAVSAKNVTASFATSPSTATAGVDYSTTTGTIAINAGATSTTISVNTTEDELLEASETFVLTLSDPVNATIPSTEADTEATITDDDPTGTAATSYSIDNPAAVTEGGSVTFTITRSGDTTGPSTVQYATSSGTAEAPADYTAVASTTVSFGAGELTKSVIVATAPDALDEADPETFFVDLSNPSVGGAVTNPQGLGQIGDDDLPPTVTVSDAVSVIEGAPAEFTISISSASGRPVTIDYATSTGSASSSDFTATGGTRTLAPGQTSFTISVPTTDDALDEDSEGFSLTATQLTNATYADATGSATITDDDPAPAATNDSATTNSAATNGSTVQSGGSTRAATGYRMVASDGGIFTFGDAPFFGSTGDIKLNKPIVGMATTPSGDGYWLVATDGGIFTFGDAGFHGSTGDLRLNRPIVGMETTPSGKGYWLVADDGGIFAFGDAGFEGSTGNLRLNKPIVGMETTPSGKGYWLVATDGGIFAFGDAEFLGSTGDIRLNQPIVGMAASPSGDGYRLVATDGGIFAFGDAQFLGSTGDIRLNQPIVGMAATPTGAGYWLVATDGGIFTFGDAPFLGSTGDIRLNQPINGMAPVVRAVRGD